MNPLNQLNFFFNNLYRFVDSSMYYGFMLQPTSIFYIYSYIRAYHYVFIINIHASPSRDVECICFIFDCFPSLVTYIILLEYIDTYRTPFI